MVSRLSVLWRRVRATHGLGRDLAVLAGLGVLGLGVGGYILAHQNVRKLDENSWLDRRRVLHRRRQLWRPEVGVDDSFVVPAELQS